MIDIRIMMVFVERPDFCLTPAGCGIDAADAVGGKGADGKLGTAAAETAGTGMDAPQLPQNRASGDRVSPHWAQVIFGIIPEIGVEEKQVAFHAKNPNINPKRWTIQAFLVRRILATSLLELIKVLCFKH